MWLLIHRPITMIWEGAVSLHYVWRMLHPKQDGGRWILRQRILGLWIRRNNIRSVKILLWFSYEVQICLKPRLYQRTETTAGGIFTSAPCKQMLENLPQNFHLMIAGWGVKRGHSPSKNFLCILNRFCLQFWIWPPATLNVRRSCKKLLSVWNRITPDFIYIIFPMWCKFAYYQPHGSPCRVSPSVCHPYSRTALCAFREIQEAQFSSKSLLPTRGCRLALSIMASLHVVITFQPWQRGLANSTIGLWQLSLLWKVQDKNIQYLQLHT